MRPEEGCEGERDRSKVLRVQLWSMLVRSQYNLEIGKSQCLPGLSISQEYCLSIALEASASSSEALEDSEKALGLDRTFSTHMGKDSAILRL